MKKVVKKAAPKKKAVVEKKTGEKYASKAMMAKHEKGESKKMRMMEGEIPMKRKGGKKYGDGGVKKSIAESLSDKSKTTSVAKMRKGGKSCSCGKASCMMCGGKHKMRAGGVKKYKPGGKKGPGDGEPTTPTYSAKNYLRTETNSAYKRPDLAKDPTQDSTKYFNEKAGYYEDVRLANKDFANISKRPKEKVSYSVEALRARRARNKAFLDEERQSKKDKLGYDQNGRPMKVNKEDMRKGGKIKSTPKKKVVMRKGGKKY